MHASCPALHLRVDQARSIELERRWLPRKVATIAASALHPLPLRPSASRRFAPFLPLTDPLLEPTIDGVEGVPDRNIEVFVRAAVTGIVAGQDLGAGDHEIDADAKGLVMLVRFDHDLAAGDAAEVLLELGHLGTNPIRYGVGTRTTPERDLQR